MANSTVSETERALHVLERHRGPKPRAQIGELLSLLREGAPDARQLARARKALAAHGAELPAGIQAWRPDIGGTYLLAVGGGGAVGRLRVHRSGSPHGRSFAARLGRQQMHVAFEVLTRRLATQGTGLPDANGRGHQIDITTPGRLEVDGDSLGVALCVALVSRWTRKAPRADTASSAAVGSDGRLRPVTGLSQKLAALRSHYPDVRRLVVAREQTMDAAEGFELLRVDDIEEAIDAHGLALGDVRGPLDAVGVRREVDALQYERVANYEASEWRRHAHRARWLADVVAAQPTLRARALGYAGLFHLHAGDAGEAAELFSRIDDTMLADLPDGVRVSLRINEASGLVDRDPERAVTLATCVLEAAGELCGEAFVDHFGRACGTLGRALVHSGRAAEGVAHLREAVAHHRKHLPVETAQSLVYLAMGLRRAGQLEDAVPAVNEALALATRAPNDATPIFARYERARCRYELGRDDDAAEDLLYVEYAQPQPSDYPRIGCGRYRIAINARRGEWDRGELERACALVEELGQPLCTIAATGIGEALVAGLELPAELRLRLERAWVGACGEESPESVLESVVY